MFSFEGNFRSLPTVSLGGKSKGKSTGSTVVEKARAERLKRETIRKELRCTLVLQSSFRSFLVRKKIKELFRQKFDEESQQNVDESSLPEITRLLCFFYDKSSTADTERLVWLCQQVLKSKNKCQWHSFFLWPSTFLQSQLLVNCCRSLVHHKLKQAALPLRMLETFTAARFWADVSADGGAYERLEDEALFWKRLIKNDFYSIMMHVFNQKVPSDLQFTSPESNAGKVFIPPHALLAQSLLSIMSQPMHFVERVTSRSTDINNHTKEIADLIQERFTSDVVNSGLSQPLYNFILPSIREDKNFPRRSYLQYFTSTMQSLSSLCSPPSPTALLSLIRLYENFSDEESKYLLPSLSSLFTSLHPTLQRDDLDSDDDDDEDIEPTVVMDMLGHGMTIDEITMICCKFINSAHFIDHCLKRHSFDSSEVASVARIAHHMLAVLKLNVHATRFLYTLAFSSQFLQNLWRSLTALKTSTEYSYKSRSSLQALLTGSHMTESTMRDLVAHIVTFASLYSHNLLSLHDVDFYEAGNIRGNFPITEVITIIKTLRDVCLSLLKKIFPEWKLVDYDVREVYHCLSTGKPIRISHSTYDDSGLQIGTAALLFKVSSRLLNQLHTRHTRRPFSSDDVWLSSFAMIGHDRSKYLSSNWRKRRLRDDNIAAHMADPSDDDLPITVGEARQLVVLTCLPFVVPFETRASIFTSMLTQDRVARASARDILLQDAGFADSSSAIQVKVRREFIYEDAYNDLSQQNVPDLRRLLRVTFVNRAGADEAGYGEGVTREFLQQLVKTAFEPTRGLFKITDESDLYPNPHAATIIEDVALHFNFLGRLLGKILYEGMQIELRFAAFFLCKLLRHKNGDVDINHLQSLDPSFYKNLMYLRSYDGDVVDLGLNFTVVDDQFGETKVTELIPGGQDITVTNDNRVRYIHLLANYKLNLQVRSACDAFRNGLASVVPLEWLRMFDHREFQTLISGAEVPIDVEDMRLHAAYSGGYAADNPTVELFWNLLTTFSEEEKRKLLFFVTSCSRPPLLGFKEMHPPFCIHNGGEEDRLPTSATCINLLRLPRYTDTQTMRDKLLYCIESQSGFELS